MIVIPAKAGISCSRVSTHETPAFAGVTAIHSTLNITSAST